MTDIFVKTTGSDTNDGSSWALAKATVQAGVNLISAAGDRVIIAPGVYDEVGITFPNVSGTSGSYIEIIGDTDSSITDGGGNTSGVTPGHVILDASEPSYGWYSTKNNFLVTSGFGSYARFKRLICVGGNYGFYSYYVSPGMAGLRMEDCIFLGRFYGVSVNRVSDFQADRCYFGGPEYYGGGIGFYGIVSANTGFSAAPDIVLNDCYCEGVWPVYQWSGSSNYNYIALNRCTLLGHQLNFTSALCLKGLNATYAKFDAQSCLFSGRAAYGGTTIGTYSDNKFYGTYEITTSYTGFPRLGVFPWLPGMRRLSKSLKSSADTTASYDLMGRARPNGTYNDIGAQEFYDREMPAYPGFKASRGVNWVADYSPAAGGGGSGVSRSRIVGGV